MESKTEYEINDSKLILFVREESEEAKDELFNKYLSLIYKEINHFKKRAIALGINEEDLTQEAMVAFSHAIYNFKDDEDAKFSTFLTLCIKRRLINYLDKFDTTKRKVMERAISLDSQIDETPYQFEDYHTPDPLRTMINTESLREVKERISQKLSPNEWTALYYDLDGKSINEIADLMGKNTKQVYNLIHRARSKVKL